MQVRCEASVSSFGAVVVVGGQFNAYAYRLRWIQGLHRADRQGGPLIDGRAELIRSDVSLFAKLTK